MKGNTLGVFLHVRKDKKNQEGHVPVYLKITLNGKATTLNLKLWIPLEKWNSKGFLEGNTKDIRNTNEYLAKCKSRVYEIYRKITSSGEDITIDNIKAEYIGKSQPQKKKSLIQAITEHNQEMESLVGIKFSSGTLKNYMTTLRHVKIFIPMTYSKPDLLLREVEYSFITKFEHFLLTVKNCSNNGVMKQIQRLNKIMNRAILTGDVDKNPFKPYKVSYKKVERGCLTFEEVNLIENVPLPNHLGRIRDVFIFQVYTGLAYCDVKALTIGNIRKGVDGKQWIFISRQKTQITSMIPILPKASIILNQYKGSDKCLPVLSNQKMNTGLKEIAIICNISKRLSTHIARHTFATTITLSNGVPIETVSRMLGHSKLSTTQIYSKVIEEKISKDIEILHHIL